MLAGWALVLASTVVIAILTLSPGGADRLPGGGPLLFGPGATDVIYNVALFVPLGAGLGLAGMHPRRVTLVSCMLSIVIELCQWRWLPSRYSSLADIGANTAGAVTGLLLVTLGPRLKALPAPMARALAAVTGLAWLAVNLAAAAVLRLDVPRTPTWWGQWAHTFASTVPLAGRVLHVSVNGLSVPDDSLADTPRLQHSAIASGIDLRIEVASLTPVAGRSQVAALVDGRGNLITAVEQEHCTLRLVDRRQGERFGFRPLALNLPHSCSGPTDTVAIVARSTHGAMSIASSSPAASAGASVRITPAAAWRLIFPDPRRVTHPAPYTVAWIALFLVPLAYCVRRSLTQPRALYGAGVWLFGTGTMAAAAVASGLSLPRPLEAASAAAAVLAGWLLGSTRARCQSGAP